MPFRNPFKVKTTEQKISPKKRLVQKLLFWIIVIMLAYAIISQVI